jgi:four helix bundle protein
MDKTISGQKSRDIYERTFSFACRVVQLYQYLIKKKGGCEVIARQVLKSGTSIGANMQEAKNGMSKADFVCKCNIALKEARETNYWLSLLQKTGLVSERKIGSLLNESDQIVAILSTIVKKSRNNMT